MAARFGGFELHPDHAFLNFIDPSSVFVSDVTTHLYDCAFAPRRYDPMRPEEFVEIDGDTDIWFAGVISRIAEAIGERIEGLRLRDHRPHIVGEIVVVLAALIGTSIEQLLEQFFKIMSRISSNLAGKVEDRRLDRQLDTLSSQ